MTMSNDPRKPFQEGTYRNGGLNPPPTTRPKAAPYSQPPAPQNPTTEKTTRAFGTAVETMVTQMQGVGAPVGKLLLEDSSIGDVLLVVVIGEQAKEYLALLKEYEEG